MSSLLGWLRATLWGTHQTPPQIEAPPEAGLSAVRLDQALDRLKAQVPPPEGDDA